ncbi:MAG: Pr6Pr family membrane protein [Pseudomonadota bacterium]
MKAGQSRLMHWYALGASLLAWAALGIQLYIVLAIRYASGESLIGGLFNFLSFFTVLTNILAALALSASARPGMAGINPFFSRPSVVSAIAAYITLIGLAYSLLLRHLWQPQGWQLVADRLLHDVMPLLFLLYWWLFVPKAFLRWRDILGWALFPALYLVYALLRGAAFGLYPYHFIDAGQLGYVQVCLNSAGILVGFLAIAVFVITLDRRKRSDSVQEA